MTVILVEGPDGGGKTYTAKNFLHKYAYQHNGPPPKGTPSDTFWWQLEGLLPKTTQTTRINASAFYTQLSTNWVVDRNWPSEQIYHRFAGRPHVFHPMAHRMFERYMLANRGIVVMCLPPYKVAYDAWDARRREGRELIEKEEDFATTYEFYKTWRLTTSLPVIEFDWTKNGPGWLEQCIYNQLEYYSKANPLPGVVYGNPGAHILIVGEQYNTNGRPQGPHIPFVGTGRNGFWFTQQLEMIGLTERDVAWVNAKTPKGLPVSPEVSVKLGSRVIIALGHVAAAWSRFNNTAKVIEVPHPAYWARFHAKDEYPLHEHALFLRETARNGMLEW